MPPIKNHSRTDQRWYSLAEAANHLRVTDRTVRNYIARGVLPASRIRGSRQVRIAGADLDAILQPIPACGGDAA